MTPELFHSNDSAPRPLPRSRLTFRIVSSASALLVGAAFLLSLGRIVTSTDPLQPADVIYVLGGSRVNRALEAARLYREGLAPRIVLSLGTTENGEKELERQGIHVASEAEISRDVLTKLGVPASAVVILSRIVDNTAQEAEAIRPLVEASHWTRLIVITDRESTRRAGYAFRRALGGLATVTAACSREDDFNPNRWWATRRSIRSTFYEAPKLFAYWLGLKG